MAVSQEAQLYPVMNQPLALQATADAGLDHQVHRALLQHAGPDAFLHVFAAARLDHHGVDTFQMQQVRKHQSRWSGADNSNLRAHSWRLQILVDYNLNHLMTEFLTLSKAVDRFVQDGDTLAIEGFTHLIPFAAGH